MGNPLLGGCPVHCRVLSNIHFVDAPSTTSGNQKCFQTWPNVLRGQNHPCGGILLPSVNHRPAQALRASPNPTKGRRVPNIVPLPQLACYYFYRFKKQHQQQTPGMLFLPVFLSSFILYCTSLKTGLFGNNQALTADFELFCFP